jgi:hypothetical protein
MSGIANQHRGPRVGNTKLVNVQYHYMVEIQLQVTSDSFLTSS